ncbi:head maturation protease, ClpP-related [Martelella endophytica]|uniref:ATP-dependent Clp protease proteolytic subunit n=1 Tax=Martelella endophytica TaxID=1486262 RepID=A0A0D5LKJ3_MAREN|nr:head maturation protease, ClpP-related [Martelella endophytica]AJY44671.1 peptidase [Martelella endophytica]
MTIRNLPSAVVNVRPGVRSDVSAKAIQRWNPDVHAATEDQADEDATISILDVIGQDYWGEGVTSKRIDAALRNIGKRDVTVSINSPGGDYFEGLAIYNKLREHPAKVTVKILGIAASAASVIAMAGDEVQIARAGFLMIHNTWVVAAGDRHALRDVADWLEPFDGAAVDIYAARTGIAADKLGAMLDRETWISGASAVDQKFADSLLPSDAVSEGARNQTGREMPAERKFDLVAARAGISRSEARELLAGIKGGTRDAARHGKPDAAVITEVEDLIRKMKSMTGDQA